MNPFLLRRREQLSDWKAFRKMLATKSEAEQLLDVARYWGQAPTLKKAYDLNRPQAWTSPWEMMASNKWCRFSVAIGMEFTLRLAGWEPERLVLKLIQDRACGNELFFVLEVDGAVWLNHDYRQIVQASNDHEVIVGWRFGEGGYHSVLPMAACA